VIHGKAGDSKWTFEGFKASQNDSGETDEEMYGMSSENAEKMRNFSYSGGDSKSTKMTPLQEYCMRTAAAHSNVHLKMFRQEKSFMFDSVIE